MGFLLKTLSILTGSSEETLLNARAEISNSVGKGNISTESERTFVFEKFASFIERNGLPRELEDEPTGMIIAFILDFLVQVTNRVLVDFYNYELEKSDTLIPALLEMGEDFESYIVKIRR